jgi:hypothetical protein
VRTITCALAAIATLLAGDIDGADPRRRRLIGRGTQ